MQLPHDRYTLEGRHPVADGGRRNSSTPIPLAREAVKEVHLLLALTNSQRGTESCGCSSLLPHYRRYLSAGSAFLSEPFTHHTPDGSDAGCKARPRGPPNPLGILEPDVLYLQLVSEQQFETKLSDTRCGGRLYESKVCCVNVPLHILKLGMVKGVEEFCPELQIRFLGQLGVLQ